MISGLKIRTIAIAAGLGLMTAHAALAESISVSPTNLAVPGGGKQTTLTVRAEGSAQSIVQVRAFRWDPNRPATELFQQDSVVVSPPISRLSARQELTVRLVRTDRRPVKGMECYRVLVDRLPNDPTSKQQIALRIRHSVPLCFSG